MPSLRPRPSGCWALFQPTDAWRDACCSGQALGVFFSASRRLLHDLACTTELQGDGAELWGGPDNSWHALAAHLDATFRRAVQTGGVVAWFPALLSRGMVTASDAAPAASHQPPPPPPPPPVRDFGAGGGPGLLPLSTALPPGHSPLPRALVYCTGLLDAQHQRVYGVVVRSTEASPPAVPPADLLLANSGGLTPAGVCDRWHAGDWMLQFALTSGDLAHGRSPAWQAIHKAVAATLPQSVVAQLLLLAGGGGDGGEPEPPPPLGDAAAAAATPPPPSIAAAAHAAAATAATMGWAALPPGALRLLVGPLPLAAQPPPATFHAHPRELALDTSLPLVRPSLAQQQEEPPSPRCRGQAQQQQEQQQRPSFAELLAAHEELLRHCSPSLLRSATRQQVGGLLVAAVTWALARASLDPRLCVPGFDTPSQRCGLLLPLPLELAPDVLGSVASACPAFHAAASVLLADDGSCYEVRRLLTLAAAHMQARLLGVVHAPWLKGLCRGLPLLAAVPSSSSGLRCLVPNAATGPMQPCISGAMAPLPHHQYHFRHHGGGASSTLHVQRAASPYTPSERAADSPAAVAPGGGSSSATSSPIQSAGGGFEPQHVLPQHREYFNPLPLLARSGVGQHPLDGVDLTFHDSVTISSPSAGAGLPAHGERSPATTTRFDSWSPHTGVAGPALGGSSSFPPLPLHVRDDPAAARAPHPKLQTQHQLRRLQDGALAGIDMSLSAAAMLLVGEGAHWGPSGHQRHSELGIAWGGAAEQHYSAAPPRPQPPPPLEPASPAAAALRHDDAAAAPWQPQALRAASGWLGIN